MSTDNEPTPPHLNPEKNRITKTPLSSATTYRERLFVPWWWIIIVAIVIAVFGYELQIVFNHSKNSRIVYLIEFPIGLLLLWSLSQTVIRIHNEEFYIGKAHIPTCYIDRAGIILPEAKSTAMSTELDPKAYVVHKPWIKTMVALVLNDPDDPTPYWLISTRHPQALLRALPEFVEIISAE